MPPEPPRPFAPNIGRAGRWIRGIAGVLLVAAAIAAWDLQWPLGVALAVSGAFLLFEGLRGWCVLRACRISTRY